MPSHLIGKDEYREAQSLRIAQLGLEGVGDAALGEWVQVGNPGPNGSRIVHVRRRLSLQEQIGSALSVVDMRNTKQGTDRVRKLCEQYPSLLQLARRIGEYPRARTAT
jgi:hypothetical protein